MTDPLDIVVYALRRGEAPTFEWSIAYNPTNDLRAAAQRLWHSSNSKLAMLALLCIFNDNRWLPAARAVAAAIRGVQHHSFMDQCPRDRDDAILFFVEWLDHRPVLYSPEHADIVRSIAARIAP